MATSKPMVVRLRETEAAALERLAEDKGISQAAVVRALILQAARKLK